MKRWTETKEVMDQLAAWSAMGHRSAIATVVRVAGSAYRREGAKLLVRDDGATVGNVSGGCLEQDVREVALRVLETGRPELRSYCSSTDLIEAWDLGVGCEGRVDVYISPCSNDDTGLRELLDSAEERFAVVTFLDSEAGEERTAAFDRPASTETTFAEDGRSEKGDPVSAPRRLVVTADGSATGSLGDAGLDRVAMVAAAGRLASGISGMAPVGGRSLFVEVMNPPPRLVIFGGGDDARPLAALATTVGFRVTVVDRRPAMLSPERFTAGIRLVAARADSVLPPALLRGEPFVVVMTHSYADDLGYLESVLAAPASYIGVLGPRHRTERILDTLGTIGPVDAGRVHGPIGLDLGGEGAEAVAIAIMAEIMAVRSGRSGEPLRERTAPIHVSAETV